MHIHTEFCGHAPEMTIPAIIARAQQLNLETIAITSHVFSPDDLSLISHICDEIADIKPDLRVIVGAEVDVDGLRSDGRLVTDNLDNIDYVVAGFHYIPGPGNFPHTPDDNPLEPQVLFESWRSTLLGIVSNRGVHTLAHPGRMIGTAIDLDIYFDDILSVFAEAAEISATNNIVWEINELTGFRLPEYYQQQWYRIYQVALDAGVKIIYGSDAHDLSCICLTDFTDTVLAKLPTDCLSNPDSIEAISR